jgi:lipopolysaccharide/colanic/teichoic acid biosynthesis glycosyltransferase
MAKRLFDIAITGIGLALLAAPFVAIACLIKLTSPGPVFFRQTRVGQYGRPFRIYKFRTMMSEQAPRATTITVEGDKRITWLGRYLRKWKIDELPQLINVILGNMSLVGPRPEVPEYVARYSEEDKRVVLSVLPGMTDFASVRFRNESELLAVQTDPLGYYESVVLPRKTRYYRFYVRHASFRLDLLIIVQTILTLAKDALCGASASHSPRQKGHGYVGQ